MNAKLVATALILVSLLWIYLAFASYQRGETGIFFAQGAAALAFLLRGIVEWRKASRF